MHSCQAFLLSASPTIMPWNEVLKTGLQNTLIGGEESLSKPIPAVLLLIGRKSGSSEGHILLTKRTEHVETHKGQMSLPGGFYEAHDGSLVHTALRECEEEIGLPSSKISLLGKLEKVFTRGNIPIVPYVATFELPFSFKLQPMEVASVSFLSLSRLLEEGLEPIEVELGNGTIKSKGIWVEGELVWGATARILEHLYDLLKH